MSILFGMFSLWNSMISLISIQIEFPGDDVTKNDFAEILGFFKLFGTTYLRKVHTPKKMALQCINS